MNWIDGHIDLAYVALMGRNILEPCVAAEKECISIPDLTRSPVSTFFGTIYTSKDSSACGYGSSTDREAAFNAGLKQLELYQDLEKKGHLKMQHEGCVCTEHLSMLLLMEGADPIRSAEEVSWWRKQGLRVVGLTWSTGTRYAGGNDIGGGITSEGKELVAALDDEGIVHDASHLSDEGLEDLFECATGRIVASHSNSRKVLESDSERHLHDDHAKEIFRRGGVVGLNLCTQFLAKDFSKKNTNATIEHCVSHVLHLCELAGNRHQVCLGSDFDGGFSTKYLPIGLKHPNQLENLFTALKNSGFTEEELCSFTHQAWERALR